MVAISDSTTSACRFFWCALAQLLHIRAGADEVGQLQFIGHAGERVGVDQLVQPHRQLALIGRLELLEQHFGDTEPENAVAEELQPFVVTADAAAGAGMGQRAFETLEIGKAMACRFLQALVGLRRYGPARRAFLRHFDADLKNRSKRSSAGQRQISSGEAPPAMEKKTILARPTKFSSGT